MIASIFSILASTVLSAGGQWSRRGYYSDLECKGYFVAGINVATSGGVCSSPGPLNATCSFKSRVENGITSAEASGCAVASTFSDQTWIPSANEATILSGASYMTINQYTAADCASSSIYEQDTFLADGKCHAIEFSKSFYKATCGSQMGFTVCDDSACTQCTSTSNLDAGIFIVSSFSAAGNTCTTIKGQPVKVVCAVLSGSSSSTGSGSGSGSSGSGSTTSTSSTGTGSTGSSKNGASSSYVFEFITSLISSLVLFVA